MNRLDAENRLKELRQELNYWKRAKRSNPRPYADEYIGLLERRIAAYEAIMPKTREVFYGIKQINTEVVAIEHWNM